MQEGLGRATIGITLDTYIHVMPGMQAEAAAKVGDDFVRREPDAKVASQLGGATADGTRKRSDALG